MRTCRTCLIEQPDENFYINRAKPDGIDTICKTCSKAAVKAYRLTHREKYLARKTRYNNEHREERLQKAREYRETHGEAIRQRARAFQQSEAGKRRNARDSARRRARDLSNPERARALKACAYARSKGAHVLEVVYYARVYERARGMCHICTKPCEQEAGTLDHIIPLAKGGEHSYANCALAHWHCNQRRGARPLHIALSEP